MAVAGAGAADPSGLDDRSGEVCVDGEHPSQGLSPLLIVVGSVGHVEAGVGRSLKPVRAVVMAVVERVD